MIGFGGAVWIALAIPLALLARAPLLWTTAFVAACVWSADLVATGLKLLVDRPRPAHDVPEVEPLVDVYLGSSLPSGHAATAVAGAVLLAYLVGRFVPALAALALAIAFSRVYVGVHYPLDVVAGAAVGAVVAGLFVYGIRTLRPTSGVRRPRGEPPRAG